MLFSTQGVQRLWSNFFTTTTTTTTKRHGFVAKAKSFHFRHLTNMHTIFLICFLLIMKWWHFSVSCNRPPPPTPIPTVTLGTAGPPKAVLTKSRTVLWGYLRGKEKSTRRKNKKHFSEYSVWVKESLACLPTWQAENRIYRNFEYSPEFQRFTI